MTNSELPQRGYLQGIVRRIILSLLISGMEVNMDETKEGGENLDASSHKLRLNPGHVEQYITKRIGIPTGFTFQELMNISEYGLGEKKYTAEQLDEAEEFIRVMKEEFGLLIRLMKVQDNSNLFILINS